MKACQRCGKPFKERTDRVQLFCSIACSNKSRQCRVARLCATCGRSFMPPHQHPRQQYCSPRCRDIARQTSETVKCNWCGKAVMKPANRIQQEKHFFCSRTCNQAWRKVNAPRGQAHPQYARIQVLCDFCGQLLFKSPHKIRPYNFCNPQCLAKWRKATGALVGPNNGAWRGGCIEYRGPNWPEQRAAALERDAYTCQHCNNKDDLDIHHIKPYQTFSNYLEANALENLVTLCKSCHTTADWEYRLAHPNEMRFIPEAKRIRVCDMCGKEFIARGPATKRCDACHIGICQRCGKPFHIVNWSEANKFCSCECAKAARRDRASLNMPALLPVPLAANLPASAAL